MNKCDECGSYAINHHCHGRDGSDPDLCDVCYWRKRATHPAPAGCKVVPVESLRRWVTGLQLGIISQRSVVEELRAILEAKDE